MHDMFSTKQRSTWAQWCCVWTKPWFVRTQLCFVRTACAQREAEMCAHTFWLREDTAELCPIVYFRKNTALLRPAHMTAAFSSLRVPVRRVRSTPVPAARHWVVTCCDHFRLAARTVSSNDSADFAKPSSSMSLVFSRCFRSLSLLSRLAFQEGLLPLPPFSVFTGWLRSRMLNSIYWWSHKAITSRMYQSPILEARRGAAIVW